MLFKHDKKGRKLTWRQRHRIKKRQWKAGKKQPSSLKRKVRQWGIHDFRKSLPSGQTIFLMIIVYWLSARLFNGLIIKLDPSMTHPATNYIKSLNMVFIFLTDEVIPFIVVLWFGRNLHNFRNMWFNYRMHNPSRNFLAQHPKITALKRPVKFEWVKGWKSWLESLWYGFWHHKRLLTFLFFTMLAVEALSQIGSIFLFGPKPGGSANTASLMSTLSYQWPMFIIIIFVAPLIEEILFRCWFTDILTKILSWCVDRMYIEFHVKHSKELEKKAKAGEQITKHNYEPFLYWLSAVLSAINFASLHDGFDVRIMFTYVMAALFLQLIRRHSQSVIPGAFIHSLSNVLALATNVL